MPDFLNVGQVLNNLDVKENMMAAEFGCGSAVFAITLAKKVKKGRVYALDIQEEKLSALKGKLALENLHNVYTILCDLETPHGSTLPSNSLDLVLIPNLLFQVENKHAIIEEGKRVLKPGGRLLVIDWIKQSSLGLKTGMVRPDEVKKIADDLDLSFEKEFAAGDYHYAIVFMKK